MKRSRLVRILTALAAAAFGAVAFAVPARAIVGGTAPDQPYPWAVSIVANGSACTGTLVRADWVLTAAHCLDGVSAGDVTVTYTTGSGGAASVGATAVRTDPAFVMVAYDNHDMGLIRLAKRLSNPTVPMSWTAPAPGTKVRQLGFGQWCPVSGDCTGINPLRQLDTVVAPPSWCTDEDDSINPARQLCGSNVGTSPCYGDSGGPMLVRTATGWAVVGVFSGLTKDLCGAGNTVYTTTAGARSWITGVLGSS